MEITRWKQEAALRVLDAVGVKAGVVGVGVGGVWWS